MGTKTAMRQSELSWMEIRKLPKPDEHTELYEYQLPKVYREKLMQRLNSPEFNMRCIEVWTMKRLYVLQLFLKDLTNDRRVRFGQWNTSTTRLDPPARPQTLEEVVIFAPSATPLDSVKMCLAQFGHFTSLTAAPAGQPRTVAFRVTYKFRESAVLAHEMVFEITGEVWIHCKGDASLLQRISTQHWRS